MKQHAAPALNSGRQMNLIFEPSRIDGMNVSATNTLPVLQLGKVVLRRLRMAYIKTVDVVRDAGGVAFGHRHKRIQLRMPGP